MYVQFDGYPGGHGVGAILDKYYRSEEDVDALLNYALYVSSVYPSAEMTDLMERWMDCRYQVPGKNINNFHLLSEDDQIKILRDLNLPKIKKEPPGITDEEPWGRREYAYFFDKEKWVLIRNERRFILSNFVEKLKQIDLNMGDYDCDELPENFEELDYYDPYEEEEDEEQE